MKFVHRYELWRFFKDRLPPSLRSTKLGNGYGSVLGIEIKERKSLLGYLPLTTGIATIGDDYVDLRRSEWLSDFENLVREYEDKTGETVEFRYSYY